MSTIHISLSRRTFIKTTGLAVSAAMLPLVGPLVAPDTKKWPVGCRDLHLKSRRAAG